MYSALNLISIHGFRDRRGVVPLIASVLACVFCFIAFSGATRMYLAAAVIAMFAVFIFYAGKDRTEFKRKLMENTKHQSSI